MVDAVDPVNIPAELDGSWALSVTVLANAAGQAFDVEGGNASVAAVAAAVLTRARHSKWSVLYVNESNSAEVFDAVTAIGVPLEPGSAWPKPGAYIWAADPSGNIAGGRWHLPVEPLAVQSRYLGTRDESDTVDNFPAKVAGYIDGAVSAWPAETWAAFHVLPDQGVTPGPDPGPRPPAPPAPTPDEVIEMQVRVLRKGAAGPDVGAVQRLVTGLTVDGIFGPLTEAAVQHYQAVHRLVPDGIVGLHTWGELVGRPQ